MSPCTTDEMPEIGTLGQDFTYELGAPIGQKATLGLIVLQSDETIEHDFRRLLPVEDVALYITRVPSAPKVTRETLAQMEAELPGVAWLLPPPLSFDAVGYGCTSGSSVIGPDRIAELVGQGCDTEHVTNPLTALVAACQTLGLSRLAFLSPYVEEVSGTLRGALADRGVGTPVFGSFNEAEETKVAKIDGPSIVNAAIELAKDSAVDAVFLSCTNLRTLDVIGDIETATGKPVLSSNLVLAWHMARLAGCSLAPDVRASLLKA